MISRLVLGLIWLAALTSYCFLLFWAGAQLMEITKPHLAYLLHLPLDLWIFSYELSDLVRYLEVLGDEGRKIYREKFYPLDTVFVTSITIAVFWSTNLLHRRAGRRALFALLPIILYFIADHWENQMIQGLLAVQSDQIFEPQISMLQTVTRMKFALAIVAALILIRALFRRRA